MDSIVLADWGILAGFLVSWFAFIWVCEKIAKWLKGGK